jgi:hypothetical protein
MEMPNTEAGTFITQVGTIGIPVADQDRALGFTNAEADHAALRASGVDADAEIMRYPVPMFVFRDADGNRLRIVQRG